MATINRVNVDWLRGLIGILLILQVVPFFWGYWGAAHWFSDKSGDFDWSIFWTRYWFIYRTIYAWLFGIVVFAFCMFLCFADLKETKS